MALEWRLDERGRLPTPHVTPLWWPAWEPCASRGGRVSLIRNRASGAAQRATAPGARRDLGRLRLRLRPRPATKLAVISARASARCISSDHTHYWDEPGGWHLMSANDEVVRVALVAGGSGGVGQAIGRRLATDGY